MKVESLLAELERAGSYHIAFYRFLRTVFVSVFTFIRCVFIIIFSLLTWLFLIICFRNFNILKGGLHYKAISHVNIHKLHHKFLSIMCLPLILKRFSPHPNLKIFKDPLLNTMAMVGIKRHHFLHCQKL